MDIANYTLTTAVDNSNYTLTTAGRRGVGGVAMFGSLQDVLNISLTSVDHFHQDYHLTIVSFKASGGVGVKCIILNCQQMIFFGGGVGGPLNVIFTNFLSCESLSKIWEWKQKGDGDRGGRCSLFLTMRCF